MRAMAWFYGSSFHDHQEREERLHAPGVYANAMAAMELHESVKCGPADDSCDGGEPVHRCLNHRALDYSISIIVTCDNCHKTATEREAFVAGWDGRLEPASDNTCADCQQWCGRCEDGLTELEVGGGRTELYALDCCDQGRRRGDE